MLKPPGTMPNCGQPYPVVRKPLKLWGAKNLKARGLCAPLRYFGLARHVLFTKALTFRTGDVRQGEGECNVSRFLFALA